MHELNDQLLIHEVVDHKQLEVVDDGEEASQGRSCCSSLSAAKGKSKRKGVMCFVSVDVCMRPAVLQAVSPF